MGTSLFLEDTTKRHRSLGTAVTLLDMRNLRGNEVTFAANATECSISAAHSLSACSILWLPRLSLPERAQGVTSAVDTHFEIKDSNGIFERDLLVGVERALRLLKQHEKGQRKKLRRLSRMLSDLTSLLASTSSTGAHRGPVSSSSAAAEVGSSGAESDDDVSETERLKLKAIEFACEFLDVAPSGKEPSWADFATWLSTTKKPIGTLLALRPGLGNPAMETTDALKLIRRQLHFKVYSESASSDSVIIRGGTMRPNSPGAKSKDSRILMPRTGLGLKSSLKHRVCYILSHDAISIWLRRGAKITERCAVQRCIVGEARNQLTVRPKVTELIGPDGSVPIANDRELRVVVIVYSDLHQYNLIYESLRRASQLCSVPSGALDTVRTSNVQLRDRLSPDEMPVLRVWLGLKSSSPASADHFLGDVTFRRSRIEYVEGLLSKKLTPSQRESIMTINKHVTVWNDIAGSGKTLRMLLVTKMITQYTKDTLIFFASATHRVAAAFEEDARRLFNRSELMPLRVSTTSSEIEDCGTAWLQKLVDAATKEETALLARVDCIIELLESAIRKYSWGPSSSKEGSKVRELITSLYAHRHEYLDQHVYSCVATTQSKVMEDLRVVSTTFGTLQKLNAQQSPWYGWFPKDRRFVVLCDELPDQSFEGIAACIFPFEFMLGGGDNNQFKEFQIQSHNSDLPLQHFVDACASQAADSTANRAPLLWHRSGKWAESVSAKTMALDFSECWEQRRYGLPTVAFIRLVLPKLNRITCPHDQASTFVIPCIFANLYWWWDWRFEQTSTRFEIERSRFIFSVALVLICMEMILAHSRAAQVCSCRILVLWSLLTPLEMLEAFVADQALHICTRIHQEWHIPMPPESCEKAYDFEEWKAAGRIMFKATENAHGSNGEVVFNFITRRRKNDSVVEGAQLDDSFMFEGLSRAQMRNHLFVEDLSENEWLPTSSRGDGIALGLSSSQCNKAYDNESRIKQRLRYLRLLHQCRQEMQYTLGYSAQESKRHVDPHMSFLPPFLVSKKCLGRLQAESDAGYMMGCHLSPESARRLLSQCGAGYDYMQWPSVNVRSSPDDVYQSHQLFTPGPASDKLWRSIVLRSLY